MKNLIYLFALILFPILIVHPQSYELSLKDMCYLSSDIIIAKPVSYKTFQSKDAEHIYTKLKFEVIDKFKGRFEKEDRFEMTIYGGTYNGFTKLVVDAPTYMIGEESVLFLSENRSKEICRIFFTVTAGVQGKFNIYIDNQDGIKKVMREQSQISLTNEVNHRSLQKNSTKHLTLNELLSEIKKGMGE